MRRIKQIEVQASQSIWDIALQEYGNAEAATLILQANPSLSITSTLEPGQLLTIWTEAVVSVINEVVASPALNAQLQQLLAEWSIVINTARDRYVNEAHTTPMATGTLPTVTNENGVLQLVLRRSAGMPDVTTNLGSIAAKKFWLGTAAEYAAIETLDANTIYHIEEDES